MNVCRYVCICEAKSLSFPAGIVIITGLSDRCTIGGSIDEGAYYEAVGTFKSVLYPHL